VVLPSEVIPSNCLTHDKEKAACLGIGHLTLFIHRASELSDKVLHDKSLLWTNIDSDIVLAQGFRHDRADGRYSDLRQAPPKFAFKLMLFRYLEATVQLGRTGKNYRVHFVGRHRADEFHHAMRIGCGSVNVGKNGPRRRPGDGRGRPRR